jgi:anthranilate synthase component 1
LLRFKINALIIASIMSSTSVLSPTSPAAPFFDADSFARYAQTVRDDGITHIPVVREILADLDTPVSTYLKLANNPYSYLFESVQGGDKWGRYSIIGLTCKKVYRLWQTELSVEVDGRHIETIECVDPLDTIKELRDQYRVADYPGLPEMIGGLVGYFGYETIGQIEPRLNKPNKPDPLQTPDTVLMVSEEVLVFDNLSGRIHILCLADVSRPKAFDEAQQRLTQIETDLEARQISRPRSAATGQEEFKVHFPQDKFEAAVERCRDYIRDGDIMQVVLSQRLSTRFEGDAINVYRALRTINPSPYMYFLNMGDFEIVGSSPEILVRLENNKVTVRPIAGTRQRGATEEQDRALEQDLLSDDKELAEHVMLIDLGRNDVGRIATIGSVDLTDKMVIERYSHVMHIVSNVEARLADGLDAIDVLKATFPAGTVSGAPKIRAMEIIHELEPIKRGVYSGAVGYLGWHGNMDTAIAIRTAVIKDGELSIQAGAGIVADSVPEREWQETMNKAKAVLAAVEITRNNMGVNR